MEVRLDPGKAYVSAAIQGTLALAALIYGMFDKSYQPLARALPFAFAGIFGVLTTISLLNAIRGAGIAFSDDEVVARWAGKIRRFRYEEIVAIYTVGDDNVTNFAIQSATAHIQMPIVMEHQNIKTMLEDRMRERGLSYAIVRSVSRREMGWFIAVVLIVLTTGAWAFFHYLN